MEKCSSIRFLTTFPGNTRKGSYRVQVNCGAGSASAALHVSSFGLSGTTLEIAPENIGSGTWSYIWYYSSDGSSWSPVIPNPGTPDYTRPTALSSGTIDHHYYRVLATRTGASTSVDMDYVSDTHYGTWVERIATTSATLSVTYAAGANVAGTSYRWYFAPSGGDEQDTGVTTGSYTIGAADCSTRGVYRVQVTDTCGESSEAKGEIHVPGCP